MCRESVGKWGRLGLHTLVIGREASVVRMPNHMDSRYEPSAFENRIFDAWLRTGAFAGDPASSKQSFVIALPPPNITGELHMGHALNGSTQDTLIRMKRMQGFETEWICGTDHASIAVHAVIDRQLRGEGLTRWDLGREKFLERVWEWRERTGATIIQQFKRLGCTLDYDHERFTMDEGYVRAVLTMFVRLYDKGYIYRDNRLINWCPTCASTISDLEVRHVNVPGVMYEVRYPLVDGSGEIRVATARPETIMADTAVAVNPADERYTGMVGKLVRVPLVDREVPIIADDHVKVEFGTGALKVTPGHAMDDFEIGRRHDLAELSAIGYDGLMTEVAGQFEGMTTEAAREAVPKALEEAGLLVSSTPMQHEVGHCDRTGDRIEPLISLQWFMHMHDLAAPSNAAVRSDTVRFHPKTQENTYFGWMDNLRPWCISRQLWWGHQIPVWYCPNGHVVVAADDPAACPDCGSTALERDQDILDTWFSSALWPFATLGWPGEDPRLDKFYPGDVLSTARDIINLWVARMLMMGIEFMGEVPFTDVLIHSTIQAPDGRRMSKSLGTGIDPLELVDEFGADATRYGLLKMSSTQDVRFDRGAIEEGAKLANKLWNAVRFALGHAQDGVTAAAPGPDAPLEDRWIASRLEVALSDVVRHIESYDFSAASKALYSFVYDFCDWYVEAIKPRLYGEDAEAKAAATATLLWALDRVLRLAHPMIPFVTEAIWEQLPGERGLLMLAEYPAAHQAFRDDDAETAMAQVIEAVGRARAEPSVHVRVPEGFEGTQLIQVLVPKATAVATAAVPSIIIEAAAEDSAVQRETLERELARAVAERDRAEGMLANERFTSKAPPAKVEAERDKLARYAAEATEIESRLAALGPLSE